MTLLTVSNQGFTVHNHMCGINFLSHFKGAPQLGKIGGIKSGDKESTRAHGFPFQISVYQRHPCYQW